MGVGAGGGAGGAGVGLCGAGRGRDAHRPPRGGPGRPPARCACGAPERRAAADGRVPLRRGLPPLGWAAASATRVRTHASPSPSPAFLLSGGPQPPAPHGPGRLLGAADLCLVGGRDGLGGRGPGSCGGVCWGARGCRRGPCVGPAAVVLETAVETVQRSAGRGGVGGVGWLLGAAWRAWQGAVAAMQVGRGTSWGTARGVGGRPWVVKGLRMRPEGGARRIGMCGLKGQGDEAEWAGSLRRLRSGDELRRGGPRDIRVAARCAPACRRLAVAFPAPP